MEAIEAFVMIHNESGIFGIDATCGAENVHAAVNVILDHFVTLAFEAVSDEELSRAKNMLRSMMMIQLESRLVICEDIARQLSTFGYRELPGEVSKKIENVSKKDIQDVARNLLLSTPVVGCVGHDLSTVPLYEDINRSLDEVRNHLKRMK